MHCTASGLTNIGKKRKENQDTFRVEEEAGLFVVADGIGGLKNGALASRFAADSLYRLINQNTHRIEDNPKEISLFIKENIGEINNILREITGGDAGTTLVLALIVGRSAYIANLGDSRAYLFRKGVLTRLTKDHNAISLLLDAGKITIEESRHHPMRHLLTRYMGMVDANPDVKKIVLEAGDRLLLCTDGLWAMLPDREIVHVLLGWNGSSNVLEKLIEKANEAGGYDNTTAVLVDCIDHPTTQKTTLKFD